VMQYDVNVFADLDKQLRDASFKNQWRSSQQSASKIFSTPILTSSA